MVVCRLRLVVFIVYFLYSCCSIPTMGKETSEEAVNNVNLSLANKVTELSYEEKLKYVSPISKPMASKKLTKKILKLIKKGSKQDRKLKCIEYGIKSVQKNIRKKQNGLVILAGDVLPIDVISHFPGWCEENSIPYCYVPSRFDLGPAVGRAFSIIVFVREHIDYKDLYDECYSEIKTLPICL